MFSEEGPFLHDLHMETGRTSQQEDEAAGQQQSESDDDGQSCMGLERSDEISSAPPLMTSHGMHRRWPWSKVQTQNLGLTQEKLLNHEEKLLAQSIQARHTRLRGRHSTTNNTEIDDWLAEKS